MATAELETPEVNEANEARDVAALLAKRTRAPNLIYGTAKSAMLDLSEPATSIDVTKMCATAIISTATEDRSEDVMIPAGCLLDNYRLNPVVYFDHGFSGISLPIAKSEDPDGNFTVQVFNDRIEATSYFSQRMGEACQIFGLIEEGIIRTASVRFNPISSKIRSSGGSGYRPGLLIDEWELLEWSWTGIPDNPEALRKLLDRGKIHGEPIAESIMKSLRPYCPDPTVLGKGADFEGTNPMAKQTKTGTTPATGEPTPEPIAKAAGGAGSASGAATADPGSGTAPAAPVAPSATIAKAVGTDNTTPNADDASEEPEEMPHGARVMSAAHGELSRFAKSLSAATKMVEHPKARPHLDSMCDSVTGLVGDLSKAYAKCYPGMKGLDESMNPDEGDTDAMVAKLLDGGHSEHLRIKGQSRLLKMIAKSAGKPLSESQVTQLTRVSETLDNMLAAAEEKATIAKSADEDAANAKILERAEALATKFASIVKTIQEIAPAA